MAETLKSILKNIFLQKRSLGQLIATNNVYRKTKLKVMTGPFAGLHYVNASTGGAYFPKLLGVYEKELIPVIEKTRNIAFDHVLNIGGGEGYYTGGFALLFKQAKLTTYEPSFFGCHLIDVMSKKNAFANRLSLKAELCTPEKLTHDLKLGATQLVFMDVEGAEAELLDPSKVKGLETAYILVEIHDSISPDLGSNIIKWLEPTHTLTEIKQEKRTVNDIPYKGFWKRVIPRSFEKTIDEGRGYMMRWFYFAPKK